MQRKFLVDSATGKRFGNYLLALQVAVNSQVAPVADGAPQINNKRRIAKVGELGLVRVRFRYELVRNIKFHVVAIRTDDGLGESDGFIAASPVEGGLDDDFFLGIALRFVETGSGLGFAENVGDAVIADAVAGTEIGVSVVIEGAPADAAGVLRIGSKLIVNARVAQRVFGQALDLVDGLGGIRVAHEFGVEIARVVGRLQGETKIVHSEYVFEEFGFLEVADTARRSGRIKTVGQGVRARVEIVIIPGLINPHAPEDDAGMIPVAADHTADVIDGDQLPGLVADVLPTGDFFQHKQSHFVASIQEMARLRIVRGTYDVAVEVVAQDAGIAALGAAGHGLSDEGKGLIAPRLSRWTVWAIGSDAASDGGTFWVLLASTRSPSRSSTSSVRGSCDASRC